MTISTSWDGSAYTAQTASDALPCGTYRIVEANAPEGYLPWEGELGFAIEGDGQVVDLSGDPVHDDAIRGGVQVTKADAELGESEAVGGNGHAAEGVGTTLSGIEFAITNASENKVLVGDAWYEPGEVVAAIETEWDEEIGSYIAKTAPDALPYGTYTIQETATSSSPRRPRTPTRACRFPSPSPTWRPARRTCWSPTATARLRPRRAGTGTPPTPTETTSCSKPTASRPV